jgi:hypothetical protein
MELDISMRGIKLTEADFERLRTSYQKIIAEQPDVQHLLSNYWVRVLKRNKRTEELKKIARDCVEQEYNDVQELINALQVPIYAESLDEALALMEKMESLIQQKSYTPNNRNRWHWTHLYGRLSELALQKKRHDVAARMAVNYFNTTMPSSIHHRNQPQSYYSRYRAQTHLSQGISRELLRFPSTSVYYDDQRLQMLDTFYNAAKGKISRSRGMGGRSVQLPTATQPADKDNESKDKKYPALIALRKTFQEQTTSDNDIQQICAHLALAYIAWWEEEEDLCLEHLDAAHQVHPNDLALVFNRAQVQYLSEKPEKSLKTLARIDKRFHPLYIPAQKMSLHIANELGHNEQARDMALRLFSVSLGSNDQLALASLMRELGLAKKAEQLEDRVVSL